MFDRKSSNPKDIGLKNTKNGVLQLSNLLTKEIKAGIARMSQATSEGKVNFRGKRRSSPISQNQVWVIYMLEQTS